MEYPESCEKGIVGMKLKLKCQTNHDGRVSPEGKVFFTSLYLM